MTELFEALRSTTWKCKNCHELNEDTTSCTNCDYTAPETVLTTHPLAFDTIHSTARYLFTSLLGGILFIIAPIVLYIIVIGGQTIPGWFVLTQIIVGMLIYQEVLYTVWNSALAGLLALTLQIPYGLARTLIEPPYN